MLLKEYTKESEQFLRHVRESWSDANKLTKEVGGDCVGDVGPKLRRDGGAGTQARKHGTDEVLSAARGAHSYADTAAWHKYSA